MGEESYKITGATIARTIVLAIAIINQILTACGKPIIPIDNEALSELISNLFLIVMTAITFWKNNSFTQAALKGDVVMRAERKASKEDKGEE